MNENSISQEYVYSQLRRHLIREIFSYFTTPGLEFFTSYTLIAAHLTSLKCQFVQKRQNLKLECITGYVHLISKC